MYRLEFPSFPLHSHGEACPFLFPNTVWTGLNSLPFLYTVRIGLNYFQVTYTVWAGLNSLPFLYTAWTGLNYFQFIYTIWAGLNSLPFLYTAWTGLNYLQFTYSVWAGLNSLPFSYSEQTGLNSIPVLLHSMAAVNFRVTLFCYYYNVMTRKKVFIKLIRKNNLHLVMQPDS